MNPIGMRFGRWTVVGEERTSQRHYFVVQCDCGSPPKRVRSDIVKCGASNSCGCLMRDINRARLTTHGESLHKNNPRSRSDEYMAWSCMVQRCTNPKAAYYRIYGARGIVVCDRWRNSYEAFLEDMGRRPSDDHSLDRIDSNGNYEPGNCRWATAKEQSNNTSRNILIEYRGETKTLKQWCETLGLKYGSMRSRIGRLGWSPPAAFEAPKNTRKYKAQQLNH